MDFSSKCLGIEIDGKKIDPSKQSINKIKNAVKGLSTFNKQKFIVEEVSKMGQDYLASFVTNYLPHIIVTKNKQGKLFFNDGLSQEFKNSLAMAEQEEGDLDLEDIKRTIAFSETKESASHLHNSQILNYIINSIYVLDSPDPIKYKFNSTNFINAGVLKSVLFNEAHKYDLPLNSSEDIQRFLLAQVDNVSLGHHNRSAINGIYKMFYSDYPFTVNGETYYSYDYITKNPQQFNKTVVDRSKMLKSHLTSIVSSISSTPLSSIKDGKAQIYERNYLTNIKSKINRVAATNLIQPYNVNGKIDFGLSQSVFHAMKNSKVFFQTNPADSTGVVMTMELSNGKKVLLTMGPKKAVDYNVSKREPPLETKGVGSMVTSDKDGNIAVVTYQELSEILTVMGYKNTGIDDVNYLDDLLGANQTNNQRNANFAVLADFIGNGMYMNVMEAFHTEMRTNYGAFNNKEYTSENFHSRELKSQENNMFAYEGYYNEFLKSTEEDSSKNLKPILDYLYDGVDREGSTTYLFSPLSIFMHSLVFAKQYVDTYGVYGDSVQTNANGDQVLQNSMGSNMFRWNKIVTQYSAAATRNPNHVFANNYFIGGPNGAPIFRVVNSSIFDSITKDDKVVNQLDLSRNDLNKSVMIYLSDSINKHFKDGLNRVIVFPQTISDKTKFPGKDIYSDINLMPLMVNLNEQNAAKPLLNVAKMFGDYYTQAVGNSRAELNDFANTWTKKDVAKNYEVINRLTDSRYNKSGIVANVDVLNEALVDLENSLLTKDYQSMIGAINNLNETLKAVPFDKNVPMPFEVNKYFVEAGKDKTTGAKFYGIKSSFINFHSDFVNPANAEMIQNTFYKGIIEAWNDKIRDNYDMSYLKSFDDEFQKKRHISTNTRGVVTPPKNADGGYDKILNYQKLSNIDLEKVIQNMVHPLETVSYFNYNTIVSQLNDLSMGKIFQYKGNTFHSMLQDYLKRSIQVSAPYQKMDLDNDLTQAGDMRPYKKGNVVYFTEPKAKGKQIISQRVHQVTGQVIDIKEADTMDGGGMVNPVSAKFYRAGYSGDYSKLEHGVMKLIGVNIDYSSGNNALLKYAVTPLTPELLENGSMRIWSIAKIMFGSFSLGARQNGQGLVFNTPIELPNGQQITIRNYGANETLFDVYVDVYNQLKEIEQGKFLNDVMAMIITNSPNDQGLYELKTLLVDQVIPTSSVKTGAKNILSMEFVDDLFNKSATFLSETGVVNQIENQHLGMQLNAVHEPNNNTHANASQKMSQLASEGHYPDEVKQVYDLIAQQTAMATDSAVKLFSGQSLIVEEIKSLAKDLDVSEDEMLNMSPEMRQKYFIRKLAMKSKGNAETVQDKRIYERFESLNFSLNEPELQKVINNSLNSYMTKKGIAVDFPGGNFIWTPSKGLYFMYDVLLDDGTTISMLGETAQKYIANGRAKSINGINVDLIPNHPYIRNNKLLPGGRDLEHKKLTINGQVIESRNENELRAIIDNAIKNGLSIEVEDSEIILPNSYKTNFGMYEGMQPFEADLNHFVEVVRKRQLVNDSDKLNKRINRIKKYLKKLNEPTVTPEDIEKYGLFNQMMIDNYGPDFVNQLETILSDVANNDFQGKKAIRELSTQLLLDDALNANTLAKIETEAQEMYSAFQKTLTAIVTRIPSTNHQSFYKAKVVGFMESNKNQIMGDIVSMIIQGYDHDVDKATVTLYNVTKDGKFPRDQYLKNQNVIIDKIRELLNAPKNLPQAEINVDLELLSEIEEFTKAYVQNLIDTGHSWAPYFKAIVFDRNNPNTLIEQKKQASDGKIMVGIFANAFKTFLATYNALYQGNNYNINLQPIIFNGKEYSKLFVNGGENNMQLQAWKIFSEYINAATDNAKELKLGPIGANSNTGNLINASLFYGISPNEFYGKEFMATPLMKEVIKVIETNNEVSSDPMKIGRLDLPYAFLSQAQENLHKRRVQSIMEAYPTATLEDATVIALQESEDDGDEAIGKTYISLATIGDEITFTSSLIMNRAMPLTFEQKLRRKLVTEKYVNQKLNPEAKNLTAEDKFDFFRFIDDANYRAEWITKTKDAFKSYNPLEVISKNSHLMGYLRNYKNTTTMNMQSSFVNKKLDSIINEFLNTPKLIAQKSGYASIQEEQIADLKAVINERLIAKFLQQYNPAIKEMYLPNSDKTKHGVRIPVRFDTNASINIFISQFPDYLMDIVNRNNLKATNPFFKKLQLHAGQEGSHLTIMNAKEMEESVFEDLKHKLNENPNNEYNQLLETEVNPIVYNDLLELFTMYELIVSKGQTTTRHFWGMFETNNKVQTEYTQFLNKLDNESLMMAMDDKQFKLIMNNNHKANKIEVEDKTILQPPVSVTTKLGLRVEDSAVEGYENTHIIRNPETIRQLVSGNTALDIMSGKSEVYTEIGRVSTRGGYSVLHQLSDFGERVDAQYIVNLAGQLQKAYPQFKFETLTTEEIEKLYPGESNAKGFVVNNNGEITIVYNLDLATMDTPIHELAHPIVLSLKNSNPTLYATLMQFAQEDTGEVAQEVRRKYANESEEAILNEIVVQYIGMIGSDKLQERVSENVRPQVEGVFNQLWEFFIEQLGKVFGKQTNQPQIKAELFKQYPMNITFREMLNNLSDSILNEDIVEGVIDVSNKTILGRQKGGNVITNGQDFIESFIGPEKQIAIDKKENYDNFVSKALILIQARGNVEVANAYISKYKPELKDIGYYEVQQISQLAAQLGESFDGTRMSINDDGELKITNTTKDKIYVLTDAKAKELGIDTSLFSEKNNRVIVVHEAVTGKDRSQIEYKMYDLTQDAFSYNHLVKNRSNIAGAYMTDGDAMRKGMHITSNQSGANLMRLGFMAMQIKKNNKNAKINTLFTMTPRSKNNNQNEAISMGQFLSSINALMQEEKIVKGLDKSFKDFLTDKTLNTPESYKASALEHYTNLIEYMRFNKESSRNTKGPDYEFYVDYLTHWKKDQRDNDHLRKLLLRRIDQLKQSADVSFNNTDLQSLSSFASREYRLASKALLDLDNMDDMLSRFNNPSAFDSWLSSAFKSENPFVQKFAQVTQAALGKMSKPFWDYKRSFKETLNTYFKANDINFNLQDYSIGASNRFFKNLFVFVDAEKTLPNGQKETVKINTYRLKPQTDTSLTQAEREFLAKYKAMVKERVKTTSGQKAADNLSDDKFYIPVVKNNTTEQFTKSGYASALNRWFESFAIDVDYGYNNQEAFGNVDKFGLYHAMVKDLDKNKVPDTIHLGYEYKNGKYIVLDNEMNDKYSFNLENVMDLYMHNSLWVENGKDAFSYFNAIKTAFNYNKLFYFKNIENAEEMLDAVYKMQVQNRLQDGQADETSQRVQKTTDLVTSAFSMLYMGFSPTVATVNYVGATAQNFASTARQQLESLFGVGNYAGFKEFTTAMMMLYTPFGDRSRNKLNLLNQHMRIASMDTKNLLNDRHKFINGKKLFASDKAYHLNYVGDRETRFQHILAHMLKDGSWDAYDVETEMKDGVKYERLVYNQDKDPRFKGENGKLLLEAHIRDMKTYEPHLVKNGRLEFGYTINERNKIKLESDIRFGAYDNDNNQRLNTLAFGRMFTSFKKWFIIRTQVYTAPYSKVVKAEGGYQLVDEYDANGNLLGKRMDWKDGESEGIFATVKSIVDDMKKYKKFSWKELKPYQKKNMIRLMSDLAIMIALSQGVEAGLGALFGEDEKKWTEAQRKRAMIAERALVDAFFHTNLEAVLNTMAEPIFLFKVMKSSILSWGDFLISLQAGDDKALERKAQAAFRQTIFGKKDRVMDELEMLGVINSEEQ